jgi:hypothetical protein
MSKERELLNKAIEMIQIVPMMASIGNMPPDFGSELILEIQELLAQPESLREGLREGISLRDHFAGLAMQVLLVDATSMNNAASNAYEMADAMLAERGKK